MDTTIQRVDILYPSIIIEGQMERDTDANTLYPWKSSWVFGDTPHAPTA